LSRIIIIDDDTALSRSLELVLQSEGHRVEVAFTGTVGLEIADTHPADLILLDLKLPDTDGISVLKDLRRRGVFTPVVVMTGAHETRAAIEAMKCGAFDYIRKPFDSDEMLLALEKAKRIRSLMIGNEAAQLQFSDEPYEIIGADKKIVEIAKQIGLLSRSPVNVLIEGESGTGKELVARALHKNTSPASPFVAINCSSVVPTLLESELFGHEKGAFTGADARKIGKLEYADEGTVFLDEIGDMPFELQSKLLRVLQEREFERVGGLTPIPFKARVIAATNKHLENLIKEGKFRDDLFYRIAVSRISVPPLRERRGDIPLLAQFILSRASLKLHRGPVQLDESALLRLSSNEWPGNVRELENVILRALALNRGTLISADDLSIGGFSEDSSKEADVMPLWKAEKAHVEKALAATGWNMGKTATLLEISPTTLRKKIEDYAIQRPE